MLSEQSSAVVGWMNHSAVRFLVVGGLSLAVDTASLIAFHGWLGIWLPAATTMAFAVAFLVNFGLNRLWAFQAGGAIGPQLMRYVLLVLVNLGLTVVIVQALVWWSLPYVAAKIVTSIGLAICNYVVSRKWIFI